MSSQDIAMVCDVLLGVSSPDKTIRTASVNKLQELGQNLGALTYCLIDIASKTATNDKEKTVKTTSLVICRKFLDNKKSDEWKKIDNNLKTSIKQKTFELLNNETNPSENAKVCDLIVTMLEKIIDNEETWPEITNLALSIFNYDPTDSTKITQIRALLKLLSGGAGFMYDEISKKFENVIPYLEKLMDSNIEISIKVLATQFVGELLSFCEDKEVELFKNLMGKVLITINNCYKDNNMEDSIKSLLEECIQIESVEPGLFKTYFKDIFILAQQLINKKDYDDEKIRELAFELVLNLVEEKPALFKTKKKDSKLLGPFLEMVFNYGLEFEKNVDNSWSTPSGNNYDNCKEDSAEDKVNFALFLLDRTIQCMGVELCQNELKFIIAAFLKKSWEFQYIALYALSTFASFDQEMVSIEPVLEIIYKLMSAPEAKLRFSAIHCINKFCDYYNPSFQRQTITKLLPLLQSLLKNENILRCQCEIIDSLISFIQFTTSDALKPYVKDLFELLFNIFNKPIPLIIRKLVLEAILEIISTMEEEITPLASVAFDILLKYFVESYKEKSNTNLYGILIECITSLGIYIKEKYNPVVPDIVKCIVEIVKGFNSDKVEPLKADLTNSLERLLPVLQENFTNLLPSLIETVLKLIQMRPKMAISSSPDEEFDISDIYKKESDIKKKDEIQTSETEDLASALVLLNTIIETIGDLFAPYVDKVESEILELVIYKADTKIRTKSSKILPNLLKPLKDENLKKNKAKLYMSKMVSAIEGETDNHVCEKYFVHLKEVIENGGEILNKQELNELFDKIVSFFNNLKDRRNKLLAKKENSKNLKNNKKTNDDDSDDDNISDLIDEDIEQIENIQSEIADNIGILLKTHKNLSEEIVSKLLKTVIPTYIQSKNTCEVKMGLYISDDLIEFLGQDMLGDETWNLMYKIITDLVVKDDTSTRQAAAYGIGNFAKFTTKNFDNYSKGLIDSLYNAMNIKNTENKEEDDDEEESGFGMAFDNMVSALGKIINYQFNSNVVQSGINELVNKWIMNLPIKYDETEYENQHEWMVDMFVVKRNLINESSYSHYFESLATVYQSKFSNEKINEKIKKLFEDVVKKEENIKALVNKIYEGAEDKLKRKLEKLIN